MKPLSVISILFCLVLGSCKKDISGCTDKEATNFDSNATVDNGTCDYDDSKYIVVEPLKQGYCDDNTIICKWRIDSMHYYLRTDFGQNADDWFYPTGYFQLYADDTYFMAIDNDTTAGIYYQDYDQFGNLLLSFSECHRITSFFGFKGGYPSDNGTGNNTVIAAKACYLNKTSGKNGEYDSTLKYKVSYRYYFTRQPLK